MIKLVIILLSTTLVASQTIRRPPRIPFPFPIPPTRNGSPIFDGDFHLGPYRLCTYNNVDFTKCIHTLHVAENNSIPLALECVQKDRRDNCLRSVQDGSTDMVVLTGHGYKDARNRGLRPVLFARDDNSGLQIAVAPRNLTLLELQEAPM